MNIEKVIAIDGPSGSGKSTMAKKLAKQLNIVFIDTGSMFRTLSIVLDRLSLKNSSDDEIESALKKINIEYMPNPKTLISVDGEDFTLAIREHHVSELASIYSQKIPVRNFLLQFQRELAQSRVCVMEGRDIGTVVFPNSFCKVFVTASSQVRAQRRLEQLAEKNPNENYNLAKIKEDVEARDKIDMEREVAPLKQAEDAILLDTSDMNEEEVLTFLIKTSHEKAKAAGIPL